MPQATDYSVPPWIRGGNPLQAVEAGASLGQRIAESNQRAAFEFAQMQAQQQRFQQEMALQEQRLQQQQEFEQQRLQAQQAIQEREQLRDDQKLMIEGAYKQAQFGLAKQKLELTAQAAASKMAAQQQFISDREQIKNSLLSEEGVDPADAERQATVQSLFKNGPLMGVSPTALASLAKASETKPEAALLDMPGGGQVIRQPSGTYTPWMRPEKAIKTPEPRFSVKPPDPTDPQSQAQVERISGVTPQQLRQFGVTNVGKYVAPVAATPGAEPPAPSETAPKKRFRYDPESGKVEPIPVDEQDDRSE